MKRFIIEILVLFVLIVLTGRILYQTNKPFEIRRLESIKKKLEIVNLGTSHGWNIDYAETKLYGTNFNIAANTLYYDLQNYKYLYKNGYLADDAIIIIPVSYFVFGLTENRTDRLPDDSYVNKFYNYLPPGYLYSYSPEKDIELVVFKVQENFDLFVSSLKMDEEKVKEEKNKKPDKPKIADKKKKKNAENSKVVDQDEKLLKEIERMKKRAARAAKHHKELSEFSSEEKNVKYLDQLLKEIKQNNQQAVLITTPYYHAYNEQFGEEWFEKNYYPKMHRLSLEYNIPYLDYSDDERFAFNVKLFGDSDHMNDKGKKAFSRVLFNDLAKELNNPEIRK